MTLKADALISLADVKTYLTRAGVAFGSDNDTILEMLINSVSTWVRSFVGRNLIQTTHTEYYNGGGGTDLILKNRPIISVTTVHVDALRAWGTSSLIASGDIMINKPSGILTCWNNTGWWERGEANIKVVYSAGYAIADIPSDIQLAICRTVDKHWRDGYSQRRLDVSSESIGDKTSSYAGPQFSKDVEAILTRYRSLLPSPHFHHAD